MRTLASLIAGVVLTAGAGHHTARRPQPAVVNDDEQSVLIRDTWHGQLLDRDYWTCGAVATITVRGISDVYRQPGVVTVVLGLTDHRQHVEIAIDGDRQRCP